MPGPKMRSSGAPWGGCHSLKRSLRFLPDRELGLEGLVALPICASPMSLGR